VTRAAQHEFQTPLVFDPFVVELGVDRIREA
jgi:hypothetical protein